MKGVVFAINSLILMIVSSFISWGVTYLGLKYILGFDLVWNLYVVLLLSTIMGWASSWVPFVVLVWHKGKE